MIHLTSLMDNMEISEEEAHKEWEKLQIEQEWQEIEAEIARRKLARLNK